MHEKNLMLFIYEIQILLFGERMYIDDNLITNLNNFISQYYREYKDLFLILFEQEILEAFIEHGYEVIPMKIAIQLIRKYLGMEKYIKLVEDVGPETDSKINTLALLFISYLEEQIKLMYAKTPGIVKIYH